MKKITIAAITIAALYSLVALLLYVFQRDMMYMPTAEMPHGLEVQVVPVDGAELKVITLNTSVDTALLYFGGNGEDVSRSAEKYTATFPNRAIYLNNYRGYGGSTGMPSESDLCADAVKVYDNVLDKHSDVVVVGRSLGSGVVSCLSATRALSKLVLVTPYDSVVHIARDQYPYFPIAWLLKDRFESIERVADNAAPTLIIAANDDTVVPPKYTNLLIERFPVSQLQVFRMENTDHNNIVDKPTYYEAMANFLK